MTQAGRTQDSAPEEHQFRDLDRLSLVKEEEVDRGVSFASQRSSEASHIPAANVPTNVLTDVPTDVPADISADMPDNVPGDLASGLGSKQALSEVELEEGKEAQKKEAVTQGG